MKCVVNHPKVNGTHQQLFMLILVGLQVSRGLADLDWAWLGSSDSALALDPDLQVKLRSSGMFTLGPRLKV